MVCEIEAVVVCRLAEVWVPHVSKRASNIGLEVRAIPANGHVLEIDDVHRRVADVRW